MSVEIQRQRAGVCAAIFADELNDFYGGTPFVEVVTIDNDFDITITYDVTPSAQNLTDLDTLLVAHDCSLIDDEDTLAEPMTFDVYNDTGFNIPSHTPVYITGFNTLNNLPTIAPADASDPLKMPAIGIVCRFDVENATTGLIVYAGPANLIDTSGYVVGDELYVPSGGGLITTTRPIGTDLVQKIAEVVRVDAINGITHVFGVGRPNDLPNLPTNNIWIGDTNAVPQPSTLSLEVLSDVTNPLTPTNNQVLQYNGIDWVAASVPSITIADLPVAQIRRSTTWTIPESSADVSFDVIDVENLPTTIDVFDDKHIDIKENGLYRVIFTGYVLQPSGTTTVCIKEVSSSTITLPGTYYTLDQQQALDWSQYGYPEDHEVVPIVINTEVNLSAGDRIEVELVKTGKASVLQPHAVFSVTKLQGVKGDAGSDGAMGPAGGSTVEVQENDLQVSTNVGTINFEGDVSVVDNGSGKTTIIVTGGGSGASSQQITGFDSILSEPMLFLTDTTRANKELSVEVTNLMWAESELSDNDWVQIGHASDADSGYVMPYDGTIIRVTGNCENVKSSTCDIDLYINSIDSGSLLQFSSGSNNEQNIVHTDKNIDFSAGDKLRLRADRVSGENLKDTLVEIWVKWRKV